MNAKLIKALQDAFPEARVGFMVGTDEVMVVLVRGHMRTVFKPAPEFLGSDVDDETCAKIVELVRQAHTEVDVFYEPADYDTGSHAI